MNRHLLLDTQAFLWFTMDDASLTKAARDTIEAAGSDVAVSWATAWEIGIKYHRHLLRLPEEPRAFFSTQLHLNRFTELPVSLDTIFLSTELSWHHRDPFDRLIIAVAQREQRAVVSSDAQFDAYGVMRIWQ